MSGTIVVVMAAVVYFSTDGWLLGPTLCGAAAALYWPHIRHLAWSRLMVNASSMGLAGAAAALVYQNASGPGREVLDQAAGGLLAVLAFWIVNTAILSVAVSAIERSRLRTTGLALLRSDIALIPLAVLGLASGRLAESNGLALGWLALVAVLALADLVIARPRALRAVVRSSPTIVAFGGVLAALVAAAVWHEGVSIRLLFPVGLAIGTVAVSGRSKRPVLLTTAFLSVAAAVAFSEFGPVVAGTSVSIAAATQVVIRRGPWAARVTSAGVLALCGPSAGLAERYIANGSIGSELLSSLAVGVALFFVAYAACTLSPRGLSRSGMQDVLSQATVRQFVSFGLVGVAAGATGWTLRDFGLVAWFLLSATTAMLCAVVLFDEFGWARRTAEAPTLNDDEVVDIVRSAILDLPASRLPGAIDD